MMQASRLSWLNFLTYLSASEMTYIVSGGA